MISLRSKITQKILNLLILNENKRFYVNELAKIIKEYPANVHKKLVELEKESKVLIKRKPRQLKTTVTEGAFVRAVVPQGVLL